MACASFATNLSTFTLDIFSSRSLDSFAIFLSSGGELSSVALAAPRTYDRTPAGSLISFGAAVRASQTVAKLSFSRTNELCDMTTFLQGVHAALSADSAVLEKLTIDFCRIKDSGLEMILPRFPNLLRQLSLRYNDIDTPGVKLLAETISSRLHALASLNLSGNPMTLTGVRILADSLKNCASLKKLRHEGCYIKQEGTTLLLGALSSNKFLRLTHLSLKMNDICSGESIANFLHESGSQLVYLNLSINPLHNAGVKAVARGLLRWRRIERLHLAGSQVSECGPLARLVAKCRRLWYLNLMHNDIGNEGAEELAAGLRIGNLLRLKLDMNGVGIGGAKALVAAAMENGRVDCLSFSDNNLKDGAKTKLRQLVPAEKTLRLLL